MDKITIIVPVYNTEIKLLDRCVQSILKQDYDDIEIIIVDDGSDEGTALRCDRYREDNKDFTIQVVHQSNKGLSEARNTGISLCTGEWLYFLDSDDSFEYDGALTYLANIAKETKCDLVVGEYHYRNNKRDNYSPRQGKEWLRRELLSDNPSFAATDILISIKLIRRLGSWFVPKLVHEDEEFTPRLLLHAELVAASPENKTYKRNITVNSIMSSETETAEFSRCFGKFQLSNLILASSCYKDDFTIDRLMKKRAFWITNMAFKAWALHIKDQSLSIQLKEIADKLKYNQCPTGFKKKELTTWICMKIVNIIGIEKYIFVLKSIYLRKGYYKL